MVLLVASTHLARAQVTVGVSAGFSHTSASVIDEFGIDIETDPLNGLVIGVVAGYEMTPHLGLQIGALYAEGGSIMTPNRTGVPDVDFGVSFLEIPVFMKVAAGGRVSPYLLAGGVVGINTDAEMTAMPGGIYLTGDASPIVERFNWALGLGAGVGTTLRGGLLLSVEGQYLFGLSNTLRAGTVEMGNGYFVDDLEIPHGADYKSRGFRFQVVLATPVG
jgi:hypothetical protein